MHQLRSELCSRYSHAQVTFESQATANEHRRMTRVLIILWVASMVLPGFWRLAGEPQSIPLHIAGLACSTLDVLFDKQVAQLEECSWPAFRHLLACAECTSCSFAVDAEVNTLWSKAQLALL